MCVLPVSPNIHHANILLLTIVIWRHEHNAGNQKAVHNYGQGSGSTTLRHHLITCHLAEWVTVCDKANIQISGDGTFGKMIAEFRGESKSKLMDCGNLLNESPMFTKTAFVNAIVGLIVTEDLVSDVMLFLVSFWVLIHMLWSLFQASQYC